MRQRALLPVLVAGASGCTSGSHLPERAAWIAAAPDSVLMTDLVGEPLVLDALMRERIAAARRELSFPHSSATFADVLRNPSAWHAPTESERSIPFTMEWRYRRGDEEMRIAYREPYRYGGGVSPGPEPGVEKLVVIYRGHAWVGELGPRAMFVEESLTDLERIGYAD